MCVSGAALAVGGIDFAITADFYSKYIWRGQNINNRSVFQPAISVKAYGFTGSIWGNLDLTDKSKTAPDNCGQFSEFDYALDYSDNVPGIDWMSFSVGTIYYRFPNTSFKPTTEIYGGLSIGVPLSPSLKLYRDLDEIDGCYLQLGLGHTFEKLVNWREDCYCGLQFGASVGWGNSPYNKVYFGVNNEKFNDFTFSAGMPVCLGSWTIKPSVNYSTMLSDEIRNATAKSDNIWVGVGLQRSF
jgi:hypothetical protein